MNIGGGVVGRLTLEPGWKWSTHVKPIAGTEWCEAPHFQYHAAGRLHIVMQDGAEFDVGPGEITALPAGLLTIDKTAPTAVSIARDGPSPATASSVSFTVTFSEAVTGAG